MTEHGEGSETNPLNVTEEEASALWQLQKKARALETDEEEGLEADEAALLLKMAAWQDGLATEEDSAEIEHILAKHAERLDDVLALQEMQRPGQEAFEATFVCAPDRLVKRAATLPSFQSDLVSPRRSIWHKIKASIGGAPLLPIQTLVRPQFVAALLFTVIMGGTGAGAYALGSETYAQGVVEEEALADLVPLTLSQPYNALEIGDLSDDGA